MQVEKDMDRLFKTEEWALSGFDAMFVCFGSQGVRLNMVKKLL